MWLGNWFAKKLDDHVSETKRVRISGIVFEIKRISPLAYASGLDPFARHFATYEEKKAIDGILSSADKLPVNKVKDHYRDVFLAGVVSPKIVAKADGTHTQVDELFDDWGMCNELYAAITNFTYGLKKKTFFTFRRAV